MPTTVIFDDTAAPVSRAELQPLMLLALQEHRERVQAAAARSKRTPEELAMIYRDGPTPRTGLARDYDVAHAAGVMLQVQQGADVPAQDVARAAEFLAALEA